jgi:hypothetical protein
MPKKRVPGHLNRRRRRRDAGPNLPSENYVESPPETAASETAAPGAAPPPRPASVPAAGGRPLRPTLRRGVVGGPGRPAAPPPLQADYTYVVQDLRQIALLAGAGFLILVGLSFVLR